ncbi:uncharacterized protein ARMOST_17637 [Armillaria ostoyae]|uniref:Uncharacterized protein n=1 Tax=Armillaria ostoyae TaxID=47428 RepID=A0A284RZI5_ARMOS|nr:uncharacterized protein ARMOST_17637 [Armillaria ostoyae]
MSGIRSQRHNATSSLNTTERPDTWIGIHLQVDRMNVAKGGPWWISFEVLEVLPPAPNVGLRSQTSAVYIRRCLFTTAGPSTTSIVQVYLPLAKSSRSIKPSAKWRSTSWADSPWDIPRVH